MLTSSTRGETLILNPNECHSMLTSAIRGIYPTPYIYIYIYIYTESESSMILSILWLNHGLFTWTIHGWVMAGCGVTGEQDIVLGKIIILQCIVFCVGAELNRRDRVWIPTIFKCSVLKLSSNQNRGIT